jgi:hypothetical protein
MKTRSFYWRGKRRRHVTGKHVIEPRAMVGISLEHKAYWLLRRLAARHGLTLRAAAALLVEGT